MNWKTEYKTIKIKEAGKFLLKIKNIIILIWVLLKLK